MDGYNPDNYPSNIYTPLSTSVLFKDELISLKSSKVVTSPQTDFISCNQYKMDSAHRTTPNDHYHNNMRGLNDMHDSLLFSLPTENLNQIETNSVRTTDQIPLEVI